MSRQVNKSFSLPVSSVNSSGIRTKVKISKSIKYIVFVAAALIISSILSIILFFNIEQIEVIGAERYTPEQVIDISEIKIGENFLFSDINRNSDKVTRLLPYIEKCSMKRKLPGKIVISVTEGQPVCAVKTPEGYAVLASNAKVLDNIKHKPTAFPLIAGINILDAEAGGQLICENEDELVMIKELLNGLSDAELENVNIIDASDNFNIRFYIDNRLRIDIGASVDVGPKLKRAREVIKLLESSDTGVVDVTVDGRVSFLPTRRGDSIYKNDANLI